MVGVADLLARGDVDEDCHFWSLLSFRRPQSVSLRDESNVRSTCRFKTLMTPMRAIMVGPLCSTTRNIASTAACQSASCCSAFGSFWIYFAASSRVTSSRPLGSGIGSWNGSANGPNPSCRIQSEPSGSLSASSFSGALYLRQGAPGRRRCRHARPSHGRPGWFSHTQPQSSHRAHFIACQAYPDFCHESSSRSVRPCLGWIQRFGQARRESSGNRRASGRFFQAEIWADMGTFPSASPQVTAALHRTAERRPAICRR
jgi:hypothetical protein